MWSNVWPGPPARQIDTHYVNVRRCQAARNADGGLCGRGRWLVAGAQRLYASYMIKMMMRDQDTGKLQLQAQGVHHRPGAPATNTCRVDG
jgi:hypothetical protein